MIRFFEQHILRKQIELDGIWKMQKITNNDEFNSVHTAVIPSCWESMKGFEDFRGKCKYFKTLDIEKGYYNLNFKGVSHTADVFFDGKLIAHHYNAYTPFETIFYVEKKGQHELLVIVDNHFSEESSLHFANDYRSYGGITRPVVLEKISNYIINYIHITPFKKNNSWKANINAQIRSLGDKEEKVEIEFLFEDKSIYRQEIKFNNGYCNNNCSIDFENVNQWDCEHPYLYILKANLKVNGKTIDDLYERFGFREVKVDGDKILLNGRALYIKGFNRHEDYGTLGCAVPENVMNSDIDMIKATGANLIRTCHYPNDERFLDLCDERGILVWEESHSRQINVLRMKNPNFKKQTADCINEMIINHYNHPSIIIWGIMNEGESYSEFGRECYKLQYEQIKSLDSSRPTTSASNRHFKDICYDLPDIISLNTYPLWYINDEPTEYLSKIIKYINENNGAGKPIIISEFGGDGMYGYRAFSNVKGSEERQSQIIKEVITKYYAFKNLSGLILWQFADCRVDDEFEFNTRAKTQNNKGVVDIYRRPKISYNTVSSLFNNMKNYREDK